MENEYSHLIFDRVVEFLEEDDWSFHQNEERGIIRFTLHTKSTIKDLEFHIIVRDNDFLVFSSPKLSADIHDSYAMAQLAEFFAKANYFLSGGHFQLNYHDGNFRFHSYVNCKNVEITNETLTDGIIRDAIYVHHAIFTRYAKGITAILFGGFSATEAIKVTEKNED